MKQANNFARDMLDLDVPEAAHDVVWRACRPVGARTADGDVFFTVPFQAQTAIWVLLSPLLFPGIVLPIHATILQK